MIQGNMVAAIPFGDIQTTRDEIKKTHIIELKDLNSEMFDVEFILRKYSISIQSKKKSSINGQIYFLELGIKQFHDRNKFFLQYSDVDELFEFIKDMKEEEFLLKFQDEFLNIIFKIEQRKKIIEIPFQLKRKEPNLNDYNKLIKENIETLFKENQNLKNEFLLFKEKCFNEIKELNSKICHIEKENKELKEKINNNLGNNDSLFKESKIIVDDDSKNFLQYCLNKTKIRTRLIYSARIDGDTIYAFNKKCNGEANTLSIIKTDNGKIIGGFFKKAFSVKDNYYDPDCFLFSLNYKEKYDVNPNGSEKNKCFFGTGSDMAIIDFGYGSSIHIYENCLNNNDSYYRGRNETFIFPNNRITSSDIYFKVFEFEVYQITEIF